MATAKVSPRCSASQFPLDKTIEIPDAQSLTCRSTPRALYVSIIQKPFRKWERPWRHQRAVALFATSVEEFRLRLGEEGRLRGGEIVLLITQVGAQ